MSIKSNYTNKRNPRPASGNSSRRASRDNSPRAAVSSWKIWLAVIIIVTIVLAVMAYRQANSGGNANVSKAGHYPNLHVAQGSSGRIKDYEGFTVAFNPYNRTPDWVGWELTASKARGKESRSDNFWQDYDLPDCPAPADYRNSGFDKGHLCPAADQKWSAAAMSDCFVMANMAPQDHALNAGAWKTLEEKERLWALRDSAIIIVAGPIYNSSDRTTIGQGVRVPSAFFKVLLAPYLPNPRAIGFIYPNMRAPGNMADYAMSVDDVEKITGLDFFPSLPDSIENIIEDRYSFTEWNRK